MAPAIPAVGLRLYVTDIDIDIDIDIVHARALVAGANGDPPAAKVPSTRSASVRDPFGLTW